MGRADSPFFWPGLRRVDLLFRHQPKAKQASLGVLPSRLRLSCVQLAWVILTKPGTLYQRRIPDGVTQAILAILFASATTILL